MYMILDGNKSAVRLLIAILSWQGGFGSTVPTLRRSVDPGSAVGQHQMETRKTAFPRKSLEVVPTWPLEFSREF